MDRQAEKEVNEESRFVVVFFVVSWVVVVVVVLGGLFSLAALVVSCFSPYRWDEIKI